MNEERPLPEGWRISELSGSKLDAHLKYVAQVSKELDAIPRIKNRGPTEWNGKPVELLTQEEREQFYFSQQPKSTQDAMLRQKERKPSEDIDYLLRPMPECIANPEAKNLNELTARRQLDASDVILHNSTKGNRNTLGESKASSASERRTAAIEAFTYSKPANLSDSDISRIKKLTELEAVNAEWPEEEIKMQGGEEPWISRAVTWLQGKMPEWVWK